MKNYTRWYDKDKYLSVFMSILEQMPKEAQVEIASDMVLNIPHKMEHDYDNYINNLSLENPNSYKRWYDYDPTLHSAIEAMKNMNLKQRIELILSISDLLFSYTNFDIEEALKRIEMKDED